MKERMTRSIRNFRNYFRHSEFVLFLFLFSFLYLFLTQFLVKLKFRRNVKKEEEGRKDRAELCDTEGRKGRGASGKKRHDEEDGEEEEKEKRIAKCLGRKAGGVAIADRSIAVTSARNHSRGPGENSLANCLY